MTLLSIKQQLMLICPYFHCLNRRVHSKLRREHCPRFECKFPEFQCDDIAVKDRKILEKERFSFR
jgi:hypothetical protein